MAITPNVVAGKTISQWTQDWWTWAVNLPTDQNPFTHPEGNFASVNNDGPVFFIAEGVPGGPDASQTINVPFGTPLLVPLQNIVDTPLEFLPNKHRQTLDELTSSPAIHATENRHIKSFDASVTSLFAEIDHVPVTDLFKNNLVDSSFFSMGTAKEGTLAVDVYGLAAAGTPMDPSKSGGYWLMINDLSPGTHFLNFGGTSAGIHLGDGIDLAGSTFNVTDRINVLPAH